MSRWEDGRRSVERVGGMMEEKVVKECVGD